MIHVRAASYEMIDDAPAILAQAVPAALKTAHQNDIRTIAMQAIGTGVFAFPPQLVADITAKDTPANSSNTPWFFCSHSVGPH